MNNELRIGNLLQDKISKTPLKVVLVSEDKIDTLVLDRSNYPLENGWSMEPIPLDSSWLERAGFEEKDNSGYWAIEGQDFILHKSPDIPNFYLCLRSDSGVRHVHQLQNLYFSLTGTELAFAPLS